MSTNSVILLEFNPPTNSVIPKSRCVNDGVWTRETILDFDSATNRFIPLMTIQEAVDMPLKKFSTLQEALDEVTRIESSAKSKKPGEDYWNEYHKLIPVLECITDALKIVDPEIYGLFRNHAKRIRGLTIIEEELNDVFKNKITPLEHNRKLQGKNPVTKLDENDIKYFTNWYHNVCKKYRILVPEETVQLLDKSKISTYEDLLFAYIQIDVLVAKEHQKLELEMRIIKLSGEKFIAEQKNNQIKSVIPGLSDQELTSELFIAVQKENIKMKEKINELEKEIVGLRDEKRQLIERLNNYIPEIELISDKFYIIKKDKTTIVKKFVSDGLKQAIKECKDRSSTSKIIKHIEQHYIDDVDADYFTFKWNDADKPEILHRKEYEFLVCNLPDKMDFESVVSTEKGKDRQENKGWVQSELIQVKDQDEFIEVLKSNGYRHATFIETTKKIVKFLWGKMDASIGTKDIASGSNVGHDTVNNHLHIYTALGLLHPNFDIFHDL